MADPDRPSIAGIVLTYHPESATITNIVRLREQVDRVFVVNNSPDEVTRAVLADVAEDPSVTVLDQPGNVGVAAGFNAGIRAAMAESFDFVWIFDQDSTVTPGAIDRLLRAHAEAGPRAGIVGPALRSATTGVVYRREAGTGSREIDVLISSGSLLSRELLETIGLHDEGLFIDYVDHDLCLRARKRGFRNVKAFDALLDHRFGDSHPVRVLGRRIYLADYSPMRQFYATRNRVVVVRRFGLGRWFWADLWFTTKAWTKVVFFERDRPAKIGAALRGLAKGLRYPARDGKW